MQKNLYYRTVLRRRNALKESIFDVFFSLSSYPRLMLEVFIKRHFGERYFSFATALTVAVLLILLPMAVNAVAAYSGLGGSTASYFWLHIFSWYVFVAAFIRQAVNRRREIKREPSVFDFGKFSLSNGTLTPEMESLLTRFQIFDGRKRETIWEPLPFFVLGFVLILFGQYVGWLLTTASVFYAVSYMAAYHRGDNFTMDKIDEMILNQEMEKAFVEDADPSQTRGVRMFTRKPTSEELRKAVSDSFIEDTADEMMEVR